MIYSFIIYIKKLSQLEQELFSVFWDSCLSYFV